MNAEPPGTGPLRRLAPEVKLVALVLFVAVVVATPAAAWPAYLIDAVLVAGLATWARLSPRWFVPRMSVELPFVIGALLLPFIATGPRVWVGPVELATAGITGAALLLTRATLGVAAAIVLAGTTPAAEVVDGLERLRLPSGLVQILSFMVRFASIVTSDLRAMDLARASRGDGRTRAARMAATAASAGALFVRCYERGERVHLAMQARGYTGRLPQARALGSVSGGTAGTAPAAWAGALALPVFAASATALSLAFVGSL